MATTRAELYESYARSVLPSISARAVIRKLAWYMGETSNPSCRRAISIGSSRSFSGNELTSVHW